jgi:hypothetical protein
MSSVGSWRSLRVSISASTYARRGDLSPIHHSHAVAHSIRLLHVVRGEKNGGVESAPQIEEVFPNILPRNGIESGGRLVEQEHLGMVEHGLSHLQLPDHAAGEGTYQRIRVPFQVEK